MKKDKDEKLEEKDDTDKEKTVDDGRKKDDVKGNGFNV